MSTTEYVANGICVSTFAGPATDPPNNRKRVQISILSEDGSKRQIVKLTMRQWADLTDAIIHLDNSGRING